MSSILVIGSTGMLGSAVTRFLSSSNHKVIESNTSGISLISSNPCFKFDIKTNFAEDLIKAVSSPIDFIINCSGVIKHKIEEENLDDAKYAKRINTDFPRELAVAGSEKSARIIQIATDCVFSGDVGLYNEESAHDAIDVYGKTKSNGEVSFENVMFLRCSVIGIEVKSHISLMGWILNQPTDSRVNGYLNHLWNGITTLHFAKIVLGIISTNTFRPGTHHVVPSDSASKFEIIKMVCKSFAREDILVEKFLTKKAVDRRLTTKFPEVNRDLWLNAGYDNPPSIHKMITEYSNWVRAETNV